MATQSKTKAQETIRYMKRNIGLWLVVTLLAVSAVSVVAQDYATAPPKVLLVQREFLKPGISGAPHMKMESAFVAAMTAAKWPTHYLGMDSMSGPSRALFLVGYDSFAAWEKDNLATQKNPTLSAALDRAGVADGQLLTSYDAAVFAYREDMSLRANGNTAQARYFEISRFKVRQGHDKEWEELVKMYMGGYGKTDQHWATYQSVYGMDNGGVYLVFNAMRSLAEVDSGFGDSKKFEAQLGVRVRSIPITLAVSFARRMAGRETRAAQHKRMMMLVQPKISKAARRPKRSVSKAASGAAVSVPHPMPLMAMPSAMSRRSLNHSPTDATKGM